MDLAVSYQQWMLDTNIGHLSRRSRLLQRLDDSIRQYGQDPSPSRAFDVRQAFDDWKTGKVRHGGHWPSDRDRNGAVSALEAQLDSGGVDGEGWRQMLYDDPVRGPGLRAADETFMNESRGRLNTIFDNVNIIFLGSGSTTGDSRTSRSDYVIHPLQHAQSAVQGAVTSMGKTAWETVRKRHNIPEISDEHVEQFKTAEEWVKTFYTLAEAAFGDTLWSKVENTALGTYVKGIIKEVTAFIPPWLGTVWSARSVAQEWAQIVVSGYKCYDIGHRDHLMATGSPLAAFLAVRSALEHEIVESSAGAAISTAAFVTRTLATHLDFGTLSGPLIGLGEAIAKAAQQITLLGFQYRAAQALRVKLKDPSGLDLSVFRSYPLLGAYYIYCADLSSLIPLANRFTPGWMGRVEGLKKEGGYVFEAAKQLIDACPFKMVNVQKVSRDVNPENHALAKYIYADFEDAITGVEGLIATAAEQTS